MTAGERFIGHPDLKRTPAPTSCYHSAMQIAGPHNFRDLGGYRTVSGREVRRGVLFRSDSLSRVSRREWETLREHGVRTIVDFREPYEREREGYRAPAEMRVHLLTIDVGGQDIRRELEQVVRGKSQTNVNEMLVEVGRAFVTDHTAVYRRWVRMLVDEPQSVPQVFHCSAGKDRTGFAAALLLRILGVPEDTVFADYIASNPRLERFVNRVVRRVRFMTFSRRKAELVRPLLVADERYLTASFAAISEHYGTFENYVASGLELTAADIQTLSERLLTNS